MSARFLPHNRRKKVSFTARARVRVSSLRVTCWDVTDGKQADARVPVHRPLLRLTVGLTAVVHEAGVVSLWPGVNDPVLREQMVLQECFKHKCILGLVVLTPVMLQPPVMQHSQCNTGVFLSLPV